MDKSKDSNTNNASNQQNAAAPGNNNAPPGGPAGKGKPLCYNFIRRPVDYLSLGLFVIRFAFMI